MLAGRNFYRKALCPVLILPSWWGNGERQAQGARPREWGVGNRELGMGWLAIAITVASVFETHVHGTFELSCHPGLT
jgi:hypothetical protein